MNRQQLSLVVVLGLISSIPAFAADPSEQGGGWRTSSEEAASSTLSGKLYRNSADQNGSAPYVVLDRWGVVRGYVAAAQGVELESCVGQQVSLQGTIKTLPGGDMPYMTCQRVLGGNAERTHARVQHASAPTRRESFVPVVRDERSQEIARRRTFPRGTTWPPIRRLEPLPLREVVLEPQTLPAADDSQDRPSPPPARRADPRRCARSAVQATNYQETLPTPVPSGEVAPSSDGSRSRARPHSHGRRPDGLRRPHGLRRPMVSKARWSAKADVGAAGGCDACDEGPCDACCDDCCDEPCWGPRRPLFCWGPTGIWVKADYLQWWESGTHVPALVTTAPTATARHRSESGHISATPGTAGALRRRYHQR